MQSVRVAAVSMNGRLGEPARILDDIATWCERAVAEKVDLVLFPELVVHGHCTPNTWELAEPVPQGPSVHRLAEQRAHPNYQLKTRRPELYGELVREQLSA
jgi:predicted amidohydrolase